MESVAVLIDFLLFGGSSAGIVALALLSRRYPVKEVRLLLWLDVVLGFGLVLYLIGQYLDAVRIWRGEGEGLPLLLQGLTAVFLAGTYILIWWLVWTARCERPWSVWVRRLTMGLWGVVLLLVGSSLLMRLAPPWGAFLPQWAPGTGFFLITAGITLTGLVLLLGAPPDQPPGLWRGWGWVMVAFLPLSALEVWVGSTRWAGAAELHLDYLPYFGVNVVAVVAWIRSGSAASSQPPDQTLDWIQRIPPAWGLTPREAEIVPWIARGLANKEIAAELGISSATVRTHVYNLFQKAGVQSRIGLLNRLRPPGTA